MTKDLPVFPDGGSVRHDRGQAFTPANETKQMTARRIAPPGRHRDAAQLADAS
jgi:hypothetical protein